MNFQVRNLRFKDFEVLLDCREIYAFSGLRAGFEIESGHRQSIEWRVCIKSLILQFIYFESQSQDLRDDFHQNIFISPIFGGGTAVSTKMRPHVVGRVDSDDGQNTLADI